MLKKVLSEEAYADYLAYFDVFNANYIASKGPFIRHSDEIRYKIWALFECGRQKSWKDTVGDQQISILSEKEMRQVEDCYKYATVL